MNAYLDASVLLRLVLGQPGALANLDAIAVGVTSHLVEVECLRTLDRVRLLGQLDDEQLASARAALLALLAETDAVEVTRSVLRRAAQPMPTLVRTLDAIHLSTALLWSESTGEPLVMATHDHALATAARAHGMEVMGDPAHPESP